MRRLRRDSVGDCRHREREGGERRRREGQAETGQEVGETQRKRGVEREIGRDRERARGTGKKGKHKRKERQREK